MLGALKRIVDDKTIRKPLAIAINAVIVATAGVILFRLLRHVDVDRVVAAAQAVPFRTILTAGIFVAAAYGTLTFYDFFALRTIGRRDVPYRAAALAGFMSYAVGHNLGAMVLTAGAVRLRLYSAWGLGIVDVAKIAFITGLTFWLGNAFVLGIAMAYAPDAASAMNRLPAWVNRAVALTGLIAMATYVAWLLPRPRVIGRDSWRVTLPNAPSTLLQIGIGTIDLGVCTLAAYTLLPAAPTIDFAALAVIFVLATLIGFASHAPGGLGVFDTAMLVALPQYPTEELLASLLIFRVLYFMLPFALAISLLVLRELFLGVNAATGRPPPKM